jgi:hypothetical protein
MRRRKPACDAMVCGRCANDEGLHTPATAARVAALAITHRTHARTHPPAAPEIQQVRVLKLLQRGVLKVHVQHHVAGRCCVHHAAAKL